MKVSLGQVIISEYSLHKYANICENPLKILIQIFVREAPPKKKNVSIWQLSIGVVE